MNKRINDLMDEADSRGSKKALMSDVVGMPDDEDKENIQKIIDRFERENPGEIERHLTVARGRRMGVFGVVDKNSNRRFVLEMPDKLHYQIEQYIPTIYRDSKHFAWFCKNFKQLTIPEKY